MQEVTKVNTDTNSLHLPAQRYKLFGLPRHTDESLRLFFMIEYTVAMKVDGSHYTMISIATSSVRKSTAKFLWQIAKSQVVKIAELLQRKSILYRVVCICSVGVCTWNAWHFQTNIHYHGVYAHKLIKQHSTENMLLNYKLQYM